MLFRSHKILCVFIFFYSILLPHFSQAEVEKSYGQIDFPTSLPLELQPLFIKGVLLLHNFQYEEAKKVFVELQQQAPNFALGYWGEAMTYNHPLWDEQDFEAGRRTLKKLAITPKERIEKAKTLQEKGFIQSVNLLYGEDGDKKTRDYLYATALRDLYQQFPEDNEFATFYTLALLGKEQGIRNFAEYMKAASVANDVFIRNPKHPGAMHYLIHAVDDPIHAPMGLNAAKAYSLIAPDAAHAAHMPSHIYLALGLWEEIVKSNEQAWESGKKRITQNNLSLKDHNIHDLHALQWLHYGYLELGEYAKAVEILKMMNQMVLASNEPKFKWYYTQMRAAHIVATEQYDNPPPAVDMNGIELSAVANNFYVNALIELSKGKDIEPLIGELTTLLKSNQQKLDNQKEPGIDYFTAIHREGIKAAEIIILQIMALNQRSKNSIDQAYKSLDKAIDIEKTLSLGYGPPLPAKPTKELLGDFLFADKQFLKACETFQEELIHFPNRHEAIRKLEQIDAHSKCPKKENIFYHRLMNPNENG